MNNSRLATLSAANPSVQPAASSSGQPKGDSASAIPSRLNKNLTSTTGPRIPISSQLPQHIRKGLSSPTDKIQSPASKAVRSLRHNKNTSLPKPQVLGSLFKSMQKKPNMVE